MANPKNSTVVAAKNGLGENSRGLITLVVLIHFCCVLTVLASNFRRSTLLSRLVSIYAPYTRGLDFDPEGAPYYHSLARNEDDDAVLAVDLYPESNQPIAKQQKLKTVLLPDGGSRWSEGRRRYFRLAKLIQANSPDEGDASPDQDARANELAKAVAVRLMRENDARWAVVRCVRRMSQPIHLNELNPGFPPDAPQSPRYDATVYTADVFLDDETGQPQLTKRATRSELAPRSDAPRPSKSERPAGSKAP